MYEAANYELGCINIADLTFAIDRGLWKYKHANISGSFTPKGVAD